MRLLEAREFALNAFKTLSVHTHIQDDGIIILFKGEHQEVTGQIITGDRPGPFIIQCQ